MVTPVENWNCDIILMSLRVKHIDGIGMRSSFSNASGSNATGIFS